MVCAWFAHGLRMVYAWFAHGLRNDYAVLRTGMDYAWFVHGLRIGARILRFLHSCFTSLLHDVTCFVFYFEQTQSKWVGLSAGKIGLTGTGSIC
jgi:hypothetical protein